MASQKLLSRESYQYVEVSTIDDGFIHTPIYTAINEMMKSCDFELSICNDSPINDINLIRGVSYYIKNPFVDKIEIIGAAQVCIYNDEPNDMIIAEIHNLCVSPVARRRGIMSSILNKIHNDASNYNKDVLLWLGVDIKHELFSARVGQYAKQGFEVSAIGRKSSVGIVYPNTILIGMNYEPEDARQNGIPYKTIDPVVDDQVNLALKMQNDFNSAERDCSKLIKLSTTLLAEIRKIQSAYQSGMGGMFYITDKEYSSEFEAIYTLGAANGDKDLTHSISGDGCDVPMGFDTSRKIYYHTHPSRCNKNDILNNTCQLGWPSHEDIENCLYYFIEYGQEAHLIFTDDGVYVTKPTSKLRSTVKSMIADKAERLTFYQATRQYMDKTINEASPCPGKGDDNAIRKLMDHISNVKFSDVESFYNNTNINDPRKTFGLVTVDFYSWAINIPYSPLLFTISDYPNRKFENCESWEVDKNTQNLNVTI
jgi:hypothetical protein